MEKNHSQVREKLHGREERCAYKCFAWVLLARKALTVLDVVHPESCFAGTPYLSSAAMPLTAVGTRDWFWMGRRWRGTTPLCVKQDTLIVFTCCAYISHGFLSWPMHICVLLFTLQPCRWMFCPWRPWMLWARAVPGRRDPMVSKSD